jgi:uncharacterized protein (DUF427 family)
MSRHPRAISPRPDQESVWDYPRPPRCELTTRTIEVFWAGQRVAKTTRAYRVLETSHPPTYYLPPADVRQELLRPAEGLSICEWKGRASYFDVVVGDRVAPSAAWCYPSPTAGFSGLASYLAFYAPRLESCRVDGEEIEPQPGGFYGGWITSDLVGPFKGGSGSAGW